MIDFPAFPVTDDMAYAGAQAAADKITPETYGEGWERARSAAFREELLKHISSGLTARDYFAIHATAHDVQIVTRERPDLSLPECRYAYADAMLRARVKP